MEERSRKYLSETLKVKCQHCGCEVMNKNYKQHLKNVHPKEDSTDLRIQGQRKVSDMFKSKPQASASTSSSDVTIEVNDECSETEKERDNIDIDDIDFGSTFISSGDINNRKRRHESGESVDSGMGDTDTGSESTVSKHIRRETKVTVEMLSEKIDKLLEEVDDLKKGNIITSTDKKEKVKSVNKDVEHENSDNSLQYCRSLGEILKAGFGFDEEANSVYCSVCIGESDDCRFSYDAAANGIDFPSEEFIPREFSNLKMKVMRHIVSSKTHANLVKAIEEKEKEANELKSKNNKAGLNLGRACMKNFILGRPYTDYESDVFLLKASGAEVGELNHSRMFPPAFRPYVTEVVHGRLVKYMTKPLEQIGHLPPVGLAADKGTYKHRSRQFLSFVTVMPGENNLLEVCTSGQPVVTHGSTGAELV